RTPIPCPDSSGSSPTGQARQSPQRRTAPDVAPEASHPPTAAEGSQSRGQSCGNCSKACHPARKKGRINAKILPNLAKSDRLLGSLVAAKGQDRQLPPRASSRFCVAHLRADSRETSLHSSQHDLD